MSNIAPEWKLAKFSLPSNAFYGNNVNRTVFTKTTTKTIIEETFRTPEKQEEMKKIEDKRRNSTILKEKPDKVKQRRSSSKPGKIKSPEPEESPTSKRHRSVSPDWNKARFSLPSTPHLKKISTNIEKLKKLSAKRQRSISPDWNTSRFSLPTPVQKTSPKKTSSPRITAPLQRKTKPKNQKNYKNATYTISQKTLDKLLPKPEIHLFDVVKYGPAPQHKDDFLFGLNLMRSEVLNKIDLLHYKKKLRNTGMNVIRTFQQNKKSKTKKKRTQTQDVIEIPDMVDKPDISDISDIPDIPDKPEEIVISEEIIEIDEDSNKSVNISEKPETIEKPAEETQLFSVFEKGNFHRNSLDSKIESNTNNIKLKRNSLPNINDIKKNGIGKKKFYSNNNKKKNIIKIKWPIARKSLLDMRNTS